jgi:CheY-like chemotaxis protein
VVSVTDTGSGIGAEMLPKVFELFVQGERRLDRAEGGLGLGLALVKNLTDLHGGTVTAESAGEGRGSTFTVRLPEAVRADEAPRPRASAAGARGGRSARPPMRVLLVDDNHDAVQTLAVALRAAGFVVDVAHDGPEALRQAAICAPDAVLVDLGLPVMDGYELAVRLRETCAHQSPRLLALGGCGQPHDDARVRAAGFAAQLSHPLAAELVVRALVEPDVSSPSPAAPEVA